LLYIRTKRAEVAAETRLTSHGKTNRIFLTGGIANGGEILKTVKYTEYGGSTFNSLPDMPEGKFGHCMTILDGGNIFVAGGIDERKHVSNKCFMYECAINKWVRLHDQTKDRSCDSCAVIKRVDGEEEIVMLGGLSNYVLIFSIK
jgi:hypothetical protein